MQFRTVFSFLLIIFSLSFFSCRQSVNGSTEAANPAKELSLKSPFAPGAEWNAYWYAGKAEITSYALEQSRYGEIHSGTVVNVFVTEDFSKEKQVKLDDPSTAVNDKLSVLKLNQSVKFVTGIYPYSLMLSTFNPVDMNNYPHAVKVTGSMQEWCGMSFYQMNNRKEKFAVEQRSYFESEGDKNITMDAVLMEDELWNLIRLNPQSLPTGAQKLLPGALYLRLSHKPVEPVQANMQLTEDAGINTYTIEMPSLNRILTIHFDNAFPYRITGWEDAYPGIDGKLLITKATRLKELKIDYWRTHTNADRYLRDALGIPRDAQ